ncbi:MAG: hypothetical protein HC923_10195 [Myxococcales bacterium]|nr:hypothetical protein [Myxococcales bacterium]
MRMLVGVLLIAIALAGAALYLREPPRLKPEGPARATGFSGREPPAEAR